MNVIDAPVKPVTRRQAMFGARRSAAWRARNPEKARARVAAWCAANPEKVRARAAAWCAANPEKGRARVAAWRARNPEKARARVAAWRAANPGKANAVGARRRARKLAQLCTCCTSAEVRAVYLACPHGHEVDHRTPLALGGLHCVQNLQILGKAEHVKKTAREDLKNIAAIKSVWRTLGIAK